MTLSHFTTLAMVLLFALTFAVNVAAWVLSGSKPALGRWLMAAAGLVLYFLLLTGQDLRLALRLAFAVYVFPHLLMGADVIVDWIKERRS